MKAASVFLLPIAIICAFIFFITPVLADSCDKISDENQKLECIKNKLDQKQSEYESTSKKLDDIKAQKDSIAGKLDSLLSQLNVTQGQIEELQAQITDTQQQLAVINETLVSKNAALDQKIELRNKVLRNFSKRHVLNGLELFLATPVEATDDPEELNGFQFAAFSQMFNKTMTEEVVKLISAINGEIDSYEKDKKDGEDLKAQLEQAQTKLLSMKNDLASKKNQTQSDLNTVAKQESTYEGKLADLQQQIDALNAKQKDILNQKNGDEGGTVGDYESPGSSTPNPSFSPAYAVFSYGAYTHYNGMSQYGAKGRADSGQDYKTILKFYYKVSTTKPSNFPSTISVQGYGSMSFQKYLYGIAEMPSTWDADALKAQAVAARTFAYRSGKPICTTQACQVFSKSKSDNPPSSWKKAVDDTNKEILNNPGTSQYSSTTGGYINNIGWDTKGGGWPGNAYEKIAKSPWFYKAWYTKDMNGSSTCGRNGPWLNEKEMADILNAWVVWKSGSDSDRDHISPVTTSCWGGDPYSLDEMASKADKYGDKYSRVTSVDVDISNGGYTSYVYLGTDKGTVKISGDTFKTVFNLRAPGYISAKSKLFDLEKR
jgi:peptidoglycan hydrolase-like amidase